MTSRPEERPRLAPRVDPGWLKLELTPRAAAPRPQAPSAPTGLREAVLRWLEQEL